jgi:hypothetical protein
MSDDDVTPQNPEPTNPDAEQPTASEPAASEPATAAIPPAPEPAAIPAAPDATATGPTWSASTEDPTAPTQPVGAVAPPPPAPPTEPPTAYATPAPVPSEPSDSKWSVKKALLIAALVLVLGLGGGFAIGRATADSGPSSLADAVQKSANGDLPLGSTNGTLQKLLQQLARNGGLQRALQDLLGQLPRNGNGRNLLPLNPNGNNNGGNNNGGNNNGGNSTPAPTTSQAFLGVAVTTADNGQGVVIGTVQTGSPAADAGLKAGDVITAVDGTSVNSAAALSAAVRSHQPGDSVRITYTRGGTSADVQVRLGNRATANTTVPTAPPA